jgi:hypothetical protein
MANNILAAVNTLHFGGRSNVDMTLVQSNPTVDVMRPRLGPLWAVQFKNSVFKYTVRLSGGAVTQGAGNIKLMAGNTEISSSLVNFNGQTEINGAVAVDLSQISGEALLTIDMEVTSAANAGITAEITGFVVIELPVTISGC